MSEETKKKLFKVSGVGIDTTTMNYAPIDDTVYNYIYTSISANNDYIIADYVKYMSGAVLIVGVDSLDAIDTLISSHLKTLGREKVDLLFIDAKCDWENYFDFVRLNNRGVDEVGVKNPESIEQLEKIGQISGKQVKYVAIDLSPLYFNYELITWCEKNSVKLFTFNPLGGYLSSNAMINAFSVPYLLSFAGTYSDVIFLSGRDEFYSSQSKKFIEDLYGKETKPIFTLKKSVNRLIKPIKKVVNTAIKFGEEEGKESFIINYNSPELLYDYDEILFSLGKVKDDIISVDNKTVIDKEEKVNDEEKKRGGEENKEAVEEVRGLFELTYLPKDITPDELYALYRYRVLNYLKVNYLSDLGWKIECVRLGDKMMAIRVIRDWKKKSWFSRKKKDDENKSINFFFALIKNKPVFLEV